MRNYSVWVTAAHQEMWQLSERTQKTLLSMGTQMFGVTSDMESAKHLALQYSDLDPWRVKRWENVWGSEHEPDLKPDLTGQGYSLTRHVVLEQRPVTLTLEERLYKASRPFIKLRPFEFLVKPRHATRLQRVSASAFVGAPWPSDHAELLAWIRYQLSLRAGVESPREETMQLSDRIEQAVYESALSNDSLEQHYWDTGAHPDMEPSASGARRGHR